ncbi:cupin-like domain-containing protein [Spartinivicinus poritis]|uniref:Cupin-like domain-containing protein n=1 Tax=Spartinivicinus poritis TaxID=2994640 RepID=A0ABT5U6R5_9GAMM|nr:cupin-like domain-containing protein [Spartinivicinus sp. A2-2]MDE1462002.1 cupin-like domain-containing protein [Spartinivicinus sp. A2-2]
MKNKKSNTGNIVSNKGLDILNCLYGGHEICRIDMPVKGDRLTQQYLLPRRPVIVRGITTQWPALEKWSFEWFEKCFGNIFTNMFANGNEGEARQVRLKHLFSRMTSGETLYSSLYVREMLPLISQDYPIENSFLGDHQFNWLLDLPKTIHGEMNVIFIGNKGTGIKNHQDSMGTHLWSAQICGRKRWLISPPEMMPYLAEGEASWLEREQSIAKYPEFAEAACLDFVLEPGEILFLPVGWWHQTILLDDSISITQDIVNESNIDHFEYELERSYGVDPKIANFHKASTNFRCKWQQQLPKRATQSIERMSGDISFDQFLENYLIPHKPVVLQGCIDEWPALSKWNVEYFKKHFGSVFIQYFQNRDDQNKHIRLKNFFETPFDVPHYAMWCLDDFVRLLKDDFKPLSLLDNSEKDWTFDLPEKERNALTWLFMGLKGSGIGNHSDRLGQHVCSAQIVGRKRWLLHPPEDYRWLNYSDKSVDLVNPDYINYPLYRNASPVIDFILEPGEVLILPDGWWHQTVILEDSISLSHDFVNASNIDSFIKRLRERKGDEYLKTVEIQPILNKWKVYPM